MNQSSQTLELISLGFLASFNYIMVQLPDFFKFLVVFIHAYHDKINNFKQPNDDRQQFSIRIL